MAPYSKRVLELLRLLDRSLADIDDEVLRRRLTNEPELQVQAERLHRALAEVAMDQQTTADDDGPWVDAEAVAALLDERGLASSLWPAQDDGSDFETNGRTGQTAELWAAAATRGLRFALRQTITPASVPPPAPLVVQQRGRGSRRRRSSSRLAGLPWQRWTVAVAVAVASFVGVTWGTWKYRQSRSPGPVSVPFGVQTDPRPRTPDARDGLGDPEAIRQPDKTLPWATTAAVDPLRWERISGVLVGLPRGTESWRPVLAATSEHLSPGDDFEEFRTLGNSWAEARTATGIRVVVGANASVRIEIVRTESVRIELAVRRGKIGLSDLPVLAEIVFSDRYAETVWWVSEHQTSLALDSDDPTGELMLVQGAIQNNGQAFRGPARLSFDRQGWDARQLVQRLPWLAGPPDLSPVEQTLAGILHREQDVVEGLIVDRADLDETQMEVAVQWCLTIDPVRAVPLALVSAEAVYREAAFQWLVDPARDPGELRRVLVEIQRIVQPSNSAAARWIMVARGEVPPSKTMTENMLVGLRPSEQLFVRELAVATLSRLTGQSFPAYNPLAPDRKGIQQVTSATRAWASQLP